MQVTVQSTPQHPIGEQLNGQQLQYQQPPPVAPQHGNEQQQRQECEDTLRSKGLKMDTIQTLFRHRFDNMDTIRLIEPEDITHMAIQPLAQTWLLLSIVKGPHVTEPQDPSYGQADITKQLRELFLSDASAPDHVNNPQAQLQGERMDLNPITYLNTAKRPKYLDITDFVDRNYFKSMEEEETCITSLAYIFFYCQTTPQYILFLPADNLPWHFF
jgi:hypothetical protein